MGAIMIAILMLIIAAKMYARGMNIQDEDARHIVLTRAESIEVLGNKLLKTAGYLTGIVWCLYAISLVVSALGYPEVTAALKTWFIITAAAIIVA